MRPISRDPSFIVDSPPARTPIHAETIVHPRFPSATQALVLAAGNGDRFHHVSGGSKLVQPIRGVPIIVRTLWAIHSAGLNTVYPRRARRTGAGALPASTPSPQSPTHRGHTTAFDVLCVAEGDWTDISADDRVGGLTFAERVFRSAARAGTRRVLVWAPRSHDFITRAARMAGRHCQISVVRLPQEWASAIDAIGDGAPLAIAGPGTVISPEVLRRAGSVAVAEGRAGRLTDVSPGSEWPSSGLYLVDPESARDIGTLCARLKQCDREGAALPDGAAIADGRAALIARADGRRDLPALEEIIRRAMYKPTDSYLARLNRRISLPISIWLVRHTRVSANALSLTIILLGLAAAWLLSEGAYWAGVAGATLSLLASVLDGSDGEVARLTHTDSNLGCWIETFGDYTYYIAIFAGLTVGVVRDTGSPVFGWLGAAALAGALITFVLLVVLRQHATDGRPEQFHRIARQRISADGSRWAWLVMKISFVATRSTMPYGILAFALLDGLPVVVVLACVGAHIYWISLALKWSAMVGGRSVASVTQAEEFT